MKVSLATHISGNKSIFFFFGLIDPITKLFAQINKFDKRCFHLRELFLNDYITSFYANICCRKTFWFFCSFWKIVTYLLNFLYLATYNVAQRIRTVLVNKNENAVFCICIERDSKARNRNLGLQVLDNFYPFLVHFLIIWTISCRCSAN